MERKKLVVFTGAGISAESGLHTFRDADGLWNQHRIEDVATPMAFAKNPKMVLEFYNQRRKDVLAANPNLAHAALAELEKDFSVEIITQNIDDLHERAGSSRVLHLHGEILKMRTTQHPNRLYPYDKDIQVGDLGPDGYPFRPHVVWFHEPVPLFETAIQSVQIADIFLIIGTSLQVYPAASLLQFAPRKIPVILIDKNIPDAVRQNDQPIHFIEKTATEAVPEMISLLKQFN